LSISNNIDPSEIEKFDGLSDEWWDPNGQLKTLQAINPIRLNYIKDAVEISGRKVLDVGCGGGILTEKLAESNAIITGIDVSEKAIIAAKQHLEFTDLEIDYQCISMEDFSQKESGNFDVISCMELLEHLPDPVSFIQSCAALLKPDGHVFLATINRTLKSYLTAIIGAEYLLDLIPRGTHDYSRFIRPSELCNWLGNAGFQVMDISGMRYIPGINICTLSNNPSVNFLLHAQLQK